MMPKVGNVRTAEAERASAGAQWKDLRWLGCFAVTLAIAFLGWVIETGDMGMWKQRWPSFSLPATSLSIVLSAILLVVASTVFPREWIKMWLISAFLVRMGLHLFWIELMYWSMVVLGLQSDERVTVDAQALLCQVTRYLLLPLLAPLLTACLLKKVIAWRKQEP